MLMARVDVIKTSLRGGRTGPVQSRLLYRRDPQRQSSPASRGRSQGGSFDRWLRIVTSPRPIASSVAPSRSALFLVALCGRVAAAQEPAQAGQVDSLFRRTPLSTPCACRSPTAGTPRSHSAAGSAARVPRSAPAAPHHTGPTVGRSCRTYRPATRPGSASGRARWSAALTAVAKRSWPRPLASADTAWPPVVWAATRRRRRHGKNATGFGPHR